MALDFDSAKSCGDGPWENLIIEGDNFDALGYLHMTHAGKVKCIYIDPPYNTGNRDYVYNDHFFDKTHLVIRLGWSSCIVASSWPAICSIPTAPSSFPSTTTSSSPWGC